MNKFWEVLEDHTGGTSASRVCALLAVVLVLGVWGWISIKRAELPDIPPNVGMLVFGLCSLKVAQRCLSEKTETPTQQPK